MFSQIKGNVITYKLTLFCSMKPLISGNLFGTHNLAGSVGEKEWEVYLERNRTFLKRQLTGKSRYYFCKSSITDVRLSSKYTIGGCINFFSSARIKYRCRKSEIKENLVQFVLLYISSFSSLGRFYVALYMLVRNFNELH